jgi:hypothetical protein
MRQYSGWVGMIQAEAYREGIDHQARIYEEHLPAHDEMITRQVIDYISQHLTSLAHALELDCSRTRLLHSEGLLHQSLIPGMVESLRGAK